MPEIIAIIPCRKGSKRLLNKNKKIFCSKSLVEWTIDLALEIGFFNNIIVSTDDDDILEMCLKRYTNKIITILKRSKELASDSTPMWKVIEDVHKLGIIEKDSIVVLLQVTSPLRLKKDVEISTHMFFRDDTRGVVSIYKKDDFTYKRNGVVFIDYYYNWIKNKTVDGQYYLMPKERSVDIDTIEDWNLAEKLMKERLE